MYCHPTGFQWVVSSGASQAGHSGCIVEITVGARNSSGAQGWLELLFVGRAALNILSVSPAVGLLKQSQMHPASKKKGAWSQVGTVGEVGQAHCMG